VGLVVCVQLTDKRHGKVRNWISKGIRDQQVHAQAGLTPVTDPGTRQMGVMVYPKLLWATCAQVGNTGCYVRIILDMVVGMICCGLAVVWSGVPDSERGHVQ
jgi:hypothetical protein